MALGRFTVCIIPLACVCWVKFHFLVQNCYYSRVSDVISGCDKWSVLGIINFGVEYGSALDEGEKEGDANLTGTSKST